MSDSEISEKGQFKTAVVGGFDKKDVLTYLDDLSNDHNQKILELEGRLEEINSQRNAFANQTQKDSTEIDELKKENEKLKRDLRMLQNKVDFGVVQNKNQRELMDKKEKQLEYVKEENKKLADQLRIHIEKSKKFDELNNEINEKVRSAKNQSDKYIETSKGHIEKSVDDIRNAINDMIAKIQYSKLNIDEIQKRVKALHDELEENMLGMDKPINDAIIFLENEQDLLNDVIFEEEVDIFSNVVPFDRGEKKFEIFWEDETSEQNKSADTQSKFNLDNDDNILSF